MENMQYIYYTHKYVITYTQSLDMMPPLQLCEHSDQLLKEDCCKIKRM